MIRRRLTLKAFAIAKKPLTAATPKPLPAVIIYITRAVTSELRWLRLADELC